MNWQILVSVTVALISLVVSHQFAAWRDRENKRREQRVNYLVGAFRSLSKANHHSRLYEIADEVEQAVSDIQFLGNEEQALGRRPACR
jgi:membrane protein implicated in regulation of membrane protease activity